MKTINLIPPKIKRQNRLRSSLHWLKAILVSALMLTGLYGAGLYYTHNYLQLKNRTKLDETESLRKEISQNSMIEKQILLINNRLASWDKNQQPTNWPEILTEIARYTPATIKISTLNLTQDQPMATINGSGLNRRTIIEYQLSLDSSAMFKDVKIISLASSNPENDIINFSISMLSE